MRFGSKYLRKKLKNWLNFGRFWGIFKCTRFSFSRTVLVQRPQICTLMRISYTLATLTEAEAVSRARSLKGMVSGVSMGQVCFQVYVFHNSQFLKKPILIPVGQNHTHSYVGMFLIQFAKFFLINQHLNSSKTKINIKGSELSQNSKCKLSFT